MKTSSLGRVEHVPAVYSDSNLGELQKKLGDLTVQAAQLDVNYGPDNPQTIEVQQQIAAIRKQIESHRKSMEVKLKLDFDRAVRDEQAFKRALEEAKDETAKRMWTRSSTGYFNKRSIRPRRFTIISWKEQRSQIRTRSATEQPARGRAGAGAENAVRSESHTMDDDRVRLQSDVGRRPRFAARIPRPQHQER